MDGSGQAKEVVYRSHGITNLDGELDDSSEGSTVKIPIEDQVRDQTIMTPDPKLQRTEENMNSLLLFLMDEIKSLKLRMEPKSENHSEISDEDHEDDNVSVNSKLEEFLPVDQERWKSSKAADQAQSNLTSTLRALDITAN